MSAETDLVSVPPSELTAPGINVLPYILLALAGPEEFDLEVLPCLWVLRDDEDFLADIVL